MTNHTAKIRAALEMARDYISSDLASERGAFEGYEGVSRIDEIKADLANNKSAIAALDALELAAAEPVAWMWEDMLGISHAYVSPKRPTWPDAGASPEMAVAINVRPLYAAPPAPVAEIREVVKVTRPMCHGAWARFWSEPNSGDSCDQSARWLAAWRAELGPALGLVEIREPTDDECRKIASRWYSVNFGIEIGERHGREMFDAVRAVMWPKEGL